MPAGAHDVDTEQCHPILAVADVREAVESAGVPIRVPPADRGYGLATPPSKTCTATGSPSATGSVVESMSDFRASC